MKVRKGEKKAYIYQICQHSVYRNAESIMQHNGALIDRHHNRVQVVLGKCIVDLSSNFALLNVKSKNVVKRWIEVFQLRELCGRDRRNDKAPHWSLNGSMMSSSDPSRTW